MNLTDRERHGVRDFSLTESVETSEKVGIMRG